MQARLTRSTSESMVAGVCGGLAEYFAIDPVIVRLLFVVVTLTSGFGLPIYLVLWVIMPKNAAATVAEQQQQAASTYGYLDEQQQVQGALAREVLVGQRQEGAQSRLGGDAGFAAAPDAPVYRFDPYTGQMLDPHAPVGADPARPYGTDLVLEGVPRRKRSWRLLGIILLGIGSLIFLE
ncbi:MAG: PspC domain-containing protein, partial [Chloroflexia bacterium]|nr:PspC domain-containing protein [Chloroflexia bacterium]